MAKLVQKKRQKYFYRILRDDPRIGCYPPWAENNSLICENETRAKKASKVIQDSNRIKKNCPDPCDFLTINIGAKNVLRYLT